MTLSNSAVVSIRSIELAWISIRQGWEIKVEDTGRQVATLPSPSAPASSSLRLFFRLVSKG